MLLSLSLTRVSKGMPRVRILDSMRACPTITVTTSTRHVLAASIAVLIRSMYRYYIYTQPAFTLLAGGHKVIRQLLTHALQIAYAERLDTPLHVIQAAVAVLLNEVCALITLVAHAVAEIEQLHGCGELLGVAPLNHEPV